MFEKTKINEKEAGVGKTKSKQHLLCKLKALDIIDAFQVVSMQDIHLCELENQ